MVSSDSESDDVFGTPEEIAEAAKNVEPNLLPTKSKSRYETTYLTFMNWRKEKNANSFSEDVLLAHISELSEKAKPSTLWSRYSMLKSTLIAKHNIDIRSYSRLTDFLKRKSDGFKSTQSKVFTLNEIEKFLNEAPDDQYLATKVALIFCIAAACRGDELTKLNVENIEHHGSLLVIKIPDTKTNISRLYTIEGKFTEIVKKYEALRPKSATTNRFFLNFQKGKCTTQPIGRNKIGKMPREIANYLSLSEPELYTGHSFRRTSATLLADTGAGKTTIKSHGGWKSTSMAEGYIENSINNKRNTGHLVTLSINLHQTTAKQNPEFEEPPIKQSKLGINVDASTSKSSDCAMTKDNSKSTFKITNRGNNPILQFENCNDDEPPEITYCVVEHTGTLTLQAMTPTLPMPAEEELNKMFLELVDELDLTQTNRQAVLALPANKKWQIYCSRKGNGTLDNGGLRTTDLSGDPEDYINRLKTIANNPFPEEDEEISNQMRQAEALKTALRTQPHSFVLRFIELDGLNALLQVLGTMDTEAANSNLHTSVIGCLKALMNNSNGRAHVLAHPTAINTISQSLASENIKTKISVLEILGAVCLVPGGHRKVLEAMLHFQQYHSERTRFQCIINDLDKNFGIYKDNLSLKTAIMSFINAVLNYGPGQVTLEFRLHLRYELLMLGIQPIIEKLRKYENETLDRHLDFFEMVRNEDEKELARKFEKEHVDTKSASAMFDLLRRKLSHTAAYPHLLSLLEHCLLLPLDYGSHPQHWLLFDRIVQQIVLQSESNETGLVRNPDVAPIDINVKEIVHLLAKEEELVAARKKAEEMERENLDMSTRLAKKEQELDLRTQEKEDMEASLARIKERLEKETSMHIETKQKISELQDNLETLSRQINNEKSERKRLEQLVASGSLPDDAKATLKIVEDEVLEKLETKPTPPPPPPPPLAPPPPPCLMPAAPPPMKMEIIKNVPQPSNPLKSFNWSKIPEQKLQGTIWSELDDTKLYNVMDLESIDKIFCAYQKNGVSTEGSIEDLRTLGKNKKTMSVIDSRRAQNCTILLSKLKMSDNEITRTILSMDQQNILHIDMVEQLLKYIPSSEEAASLDIHQKELQNRADCFLYQISKVPHYEQRLRSLHYKKKFAASIAELTPRMRAVLEASRQVARSRRLRKLLELVLALGNYVNRGNARGNACGFRLASLNRLVDTKSSCSKGTTLLHYLVQILEARFREVLEIEEDMPHVKTAAKVSMADLQKEVANLKNGLQDVQREIEFHRGQAQVLQGDMFLPAMRDFQAQATCRLAEAEDLFQDMKTRFDRAVRLFGEDSAGVQPDEFFGIFENFLQALAEARQDVENMRKKIEEDERRAKQEQELRKRTIERKNSREGILNSISLSKKNEANSNGQQNDNKGEFDDLISALRTGDVFGEDIAKFKRSKRRPVTPSGQESRRHSTHKEDSRERH